MKRLSVVVITQNEEANLRRCLDSVTWADELVVIDSGSTDRTCEIASDMGAHVFSVPWKGYGPAKQEGVRLASGDWILSLDADEEVSPPLAAEIRKVVANGSECAGFLIPRRTEFLGCWILHCGWYPDPVLRLFRKDSGTFNDAAVHEKVELQGETGRLQGELYHYSYPSLESYFEKFNRYTSIAAREAYDEGKRASWSDIVVRPVAAFLKHYVSKRGFLDGVEGFIVSVLSSTYVLVKYAKLRDLARTRKAPVA